MSEVVLQTIFGMLVFPIMMIGIFFYVSVPVILLGTYVALNEVIKRRFKERILDEADLNRKASTTSLLSMLTAVGITSLLAFVFGKKIFDALCDADCYVGFGDIMTVAMIIGASTILAVILSIVCAKQLIREELADLNNQSPPTPAA